MLMVLSFLLCIPVIIVIALISFLKGSQISSLWSSTSVRVWVWNNLFGLHFCEQRIEYLPCLLQLVASHEGGLASIQAIKNQSGICVWRINTFVSTVYQPAPHHTMQNNKYRLKYWSSAEHNTRYCTYSVWLSFALSHLLA